MKFNFSPRVTIFCGILALLMLRASYWQYERYLAKTSYIQELDNRLRIPPQDFKLLADGATSPAEVYHRMVKVSGEWDYGREVILRNRKLENVAGVHVVTPLRVNGFEKRLLVSRGFLPLSVSGRDERAKYRNGPSGEFLALLKEPSTQRLFAPADPPAGPDKPWVDGWLRVDVEAIAGQLPYPVFPYFAELISNESGKLDAIDSSKFLLQKSERDQILFLPGAGADLNRVGDDLKEANYPVPVFDTIVPAGRHFSYIFEWAIMALGVIITALILQFRPRPIR